MEKLGGNRIHPLGLGDHNDDLEADFKKWKDQMWVALKQKYHVTESITSNGGGNNNRTSSTTLPDCPYNIVYHNKGSPTKHIPLENVHGSSRHYFTPDDCPVAAIRELRSPHAEGSTVHIELDIPSSASASPSSSSTSSVQDYKTADNLGVMPVNTDATVESVASCLGYDLDAVFSLTESPGHEWHGAPFPMPCTIRECLKRYIDLTVLRTFKKSLARCKPLFCDVEEQSGVNSKFIRFVQNQSTQHGFARSNRVSSVGIPTS